jgi:hypothetical protein
MSILGGKSRALHELFNKSNYYEIWQEWGVAALCNFRIGVKAKRMQVLFALML